MKNENLVSIITASYNSSDFIGETIESIINQTYTNWELLITDDCSSDNSVDVINDYVKKDPRIKLFILPENSGAGVARNNSIKEAQGRYIAFCDSDDRWLPEKLEQQLKFMQEKNCALTYSSYHKCSESGEESLGDVICKPRLRYRNLLVSNEIGCLTAIYDTEKVGKVYMPTIRKRQDWGLWLNIIKKCKIAYGLQKPLAIYRIRKVSVSSNKFSLVKYNVRVYNEVLGYSKFSSYIIFLFVFMPNFVLKKVKDKLIKR